MNHLSSLRLKMLTLLFVLVTAVLLGNGWLLSSNINELHKHQRSVEHTYSVLAQMESMLSDVRAAESQSRAYMLSKDSAFLGTYRANIESAWAHFNQAETLYTDNSRQIQAGVRLKALLSDRIQALDKTIEDFNHNGRVGEEYFQRGAQLMRDLRSHVDRMEQEEERLLQSRSDQAAKSYDYVQITLGAVTLLNFLLAVGIFVLIRRQIVRQAEELEEQARESRLRTGEADAAKLVAGENPIEEMAQQAVEFVSRDLNVPGVNFFVIEGGRAQLVAGYAASSEQKVSDINLELGKGLIGSAATRESVLQVSEVPADYFRIRSSWGEAVPKALAFAPLRFQGKPVGLLEIASFRELTKEDLEWLDVVGKAIGTGVSASVSRQHLQSLLEETQRQSEELQTQQEELRTSNEELEEQTRALMQTQERLQVQQEELQQINEELEQQTRALEGQREILNDRNHDLEILQSETAKKAQELERISQYKSEFLAKMSHELRTPLNSLMILATLLHENKQGNLSTQQVDFARTIFEAGGDLLNLINDILDLSKLEARKLTARPEPFSIRTFFDQVVSTFRPMVEPKGLGLRVHIEEGVPERMVTDRQRLQQILRNLLSNAVKFTEQGEVSVIVSPAASAGRVRIAVRDTGVGIPEEKKQLIFEAFEQADGSVSRKYGGTGLGLTISRELAGLLGGQISVESSPGEGSCFTIEVPVELNTSAEREAGEAQAAKASSQQLQVVKPAFSEAATPASRMSAGGPDKKAPSEVVARLLAKIPSGAKTILIVEDDANFRASVAEAAKGHGFFPIEVGDGESALEVLQAHVPQAILLDIRLPGVSGLTLLEVVKEMPELRHVPIHMISALEHQQNALRMGAIGYLGKPITIEGVRSALSRIESVISREVKRLLVVEDDMTQRKAISELVQGGDVEIVGVGTGREAIDVLSKSVIDCVILDLSLPDYSGFELLEKLNEREDVSLPPVIIYTGKDLSKEEEEKLRRYSDSIIIKGAKSPERLLDEVSLFLHRVETALPEEKRAMLADLRNKDRAFDGRNILVVDDDLRNVFALTSALESKGFHVKVARNGLEALDALDRDSSIDVVLMDIMMPKMDGFEAMKRIRANPLFRKLPIIALTAKTMKGEYERCIQAGASDYLPKPINLPSLLSVLKVWLPTPGIMA